MSNQEQKQEQACTECGGIRISKVEMQDLNEIEQIQYHPIVCQHCKGSGIEPNQHKPIKED